jgi:hypothetical protein
MKTFFLVLVAAAACTKPNPNRCCTDEADCVAQGLPADSQCDDGLLCRGGQCIAQTCSSASDCDASAPFCIDSACTEMCTADDQCPGFGGDASRSFCVSGACTQCRGGSIADCSGATPVCDAGSCRSCQSHAECSSGVCAPDGSCATETEIAYVEPGGSDTTDCSKATKCSLPHGVSVAKPYVVLSPGTYTLSATLTLGGTVSLIGAVSPRPSITSTAAGPILRIAAFGDITLDSVQVRAGMSTGIDCPQSPTGNRRLKLLRVDVSLNNGSGIEAHACNVDAFHSTFVDNVVSGMALIDGTGTIDGCYALSNGASGFNLDNGPYKVRNSIAARNVSAGFDVNPSAGVVVEFCTFVDNAGGISCGTTGYSFPNNLLVRNTSNSSQCTFPSSIVQDSVSGLNFKSPNAEPYDYHITANSLAIDMATGVNVDTDFDGDARPQGAGRDVGADEYKP